MGHGAPRGRLGDGGRVGHAHVNGLFDHGFHQKTIEFGLGGVDGDRQFAGDLREGVEQRIVGRGGALDGPRRHPARDFLGDGQRHPFRGIVSLGLDERAPLV